MIFVLILCVGLVQSYKNSTLQKPIYDLESAAEYFETFVQQFNKQYKDDSEKQMRFEIFKENLKFINKMNNNPNETMQFGINHFTDMKSEEFARTHGFVKTHDVEDDNVVKINKAKGIELPENLDWRSYFPPIKNQGTCGVCWAFATVGSIEGHYKIKHNLIASFSEQQLLDCTAAKGCGEKDSISLSDAAQYIINVGGLMYDTEYPYINQKSQCKFNQGKAMVRVNRYHPLDLTNNEQLAMEQLQNGPFTVGIYALGESFQRAHGKGILSNCEAGKLDHAVVLAGYGIENDIPYWLIRNSWSTNWGDEGYLKIARNGPACGMLNEFAITYEIA